MTLEPPQHLVNGGAARIHLATNLLTFAKHGVDAAAVKLYPAILFALTLFIHTTYLSEIGEVLNAYGGWLFAGYSVGEQ